MMTISSICMLFTYLFNLPGFPKDSVLQNMCDEITRIDQKATLSSVAPSFPLERHKNGVLQNICGEVLQNICGGIAQYLR